MKSLILLLNLALIGFLCYSGYLKSKSSIRTWYWCSLLLHIVSGLAIGVLYFYHYKQGDTLSFFSDGAKVAELAKQNPFSYLTFLWSSQAPNNFVNSLFFQDSRALFMVKLTSLTNLLTFNNYWIASLYFSLLSFFASWKLTNTLLYYYPTHKASLLFSFLLLPSVVMWSSGIVKESVALAMLFYLVHLFMHFYKKSTLARHQLVLFVAALWLLYTLKYYYAAVLLPVLLTTLLHQQLSKILQKNSFWFNIPLWLVLFLTISLSVTQLHPNFHPDRFLWVLFNNYLDFQSFSQVNDVMLFPTLQESWISVIINAPWAFFSGLFRPLIWESTNALQFVASLENLVLLIFAITALPSLLKLRGNKDIILILTTLVFCFVLCVFLTLSTPNFGTLIRYRVGFLPFFVFLITCSNSFFHQLVKFLSTLAERLVTKNS